MARKASWAAAAAATLCLVAPAAAPAAERRAPMRWPSDAAASTEAAGRWLIGVRPGAPVPARLLGGGVRRVGARTLSVPRSRVRAIGDALRRRGALSYAEPDARVTRSSTWETDPNGWGRGAVVTGGLPYPGVSAPIAVVDDYVDDTHPDLAGQVTYLGGQTATIDGAHGTEVASAAAAAANGLGVVGVAPGAPIASFGLAAEAGCADVAAGVDAAVRADLPIVNLSVGTTADCFTLYLAVQRAYGAGTLVVAAAGNDFEAGNPVIYPAAYPHVLSVAALGLDLSSAYFSTENMAVDVAAPGVGVPLAIPGAFDVEDGIYDGYTTADGTSYAAPMVAGAAAWVLGARPDLSAGQLADVLRFSSVDVDEQGYDSGTGYGIVNVGAALGYVTPRQDPTEPNDGITLVNGSVFERRDRYVWTGQRSVSFGAAVDWIEDPVDVYRFRLPGRARVLVTVRPAFGDPDLEIYGRRARYVGHTRERVCRSRRPGRAVDDCDIYTDGSRSQTGYVAVSSDGVSDYRLTFRRLRRG